MRLQEMRRSLPLLSRRLRAAHVAGPRAATDLQQMLAATGRLGAGGNSLRAPARVIACCSPERINPAAAHIPDRGMLEQPDHVSGCTRLWGRCMQRKLLGVVKGNARSTIAE
eukprot:gene15159-biopygen6660